MSVYEAPVSTSAETQLVSTQATCGVNCNWGFGVGVAIAMIGPLPGPT